MTSTQPYQTAEFPTRETDTHYHTEPVCVMVDYSPHPTCPILDSSDLYHAGLVNMPRAIETGKHMC